MPTHILPTLSAGTFSGTILGIAGFLSFMSYGGNHGCFPIVDRLFNGAGYESCGEFGFIVGILLGSLIGILLIQKRAVSQPLIISIVFFLGAFLIPIIYGLLTFGSASLFKTQEALSFIVPIIVAFEIISLLTSAFSLFIIGLIQWLTRNFILFLQQLTHTR